MCGTEWQQKMLTGSHLAATRGRPICSAKLTQSLFYRVGRIEPIPEHYVEVGKVEKVWKTAFRLIPSHQIQKGDSLAIEVGDLFKEITANSLQIDTKSVPEIAHGETGGIGLDSADDLLREGMRVFLVKKD